MALPPRVLGGLGSFAIVAGSMLGGGIFLAPPIAAQYVGSSWQFLLIWLVGGISHGALKGVWLAMRRLARCHPYHPGGYDPVP